jgi:pyruvate/2-oxoglutarate/acetoin dehydrogenase E1 component
MSRNGVSYVQAIDEAKREEMRRDPAIFIMGENVTNSRLTVEFPDRILDTPISEAGFLGAGLGAALTGMRPIVDIMFVDLMGLVMDQLNNQIAKITYMSGGDVTVPLVIETFEGASGGSAAQHSQSLEGWFIHIPGINVVVPSTPYDAKGLMKTALRTNSPTLFLKHKLCRSHKQVLPTEEYTLPFSVADVKRAGRDVTVVTWLHMVSKTLAAADALAKQGVDVEVVDPRTLAPLDMATILRSVEKTGRLVIAEEECKTGGAAAEIAARVAEEGFDLLDRPIRRVAARDVPIPYSKPLEDFVIPQVEDILKAVKAILT